MTREADRNQMVGVRLAGLALFLISSGLPPVYFEELLSILTSWLPGEFGEVHHSKRFVSDFRKACFRTLKRYQLWDIHAHLSALQLPSDYAIVSDACPTKTEIHTFLGWAELTSFLTP